MKQMQLRNITYLPLAELGTGIPSVGFADELAGSIFRERRGEELLGAVRRAVRGARVEELPQP
jgi:hypothetical protein